MSTLDQYFVSDNLGFFRLSGTSSRSIGMTEIRSKIFQPIVNFGAVCVANGGKITKFPSSIGLLN